MRNEYYFVYCNGILGVKTNIRDFKWIYGSIAPLVSLEEYKKCVVRLEIYIKPEKQLLKTETYDKKFQSYTWSSKDRTIFYRRFLPLNFEIGYNLKINENIVLAEIGEHYYKYVKNRTMNLHGIYYLLSDIVNVMLLNKGFLTLYASAVYNKTKNRGIVNFAPPNTGKTYTATTLCELSDYNLVSEDIVICDGHKIYACPWTSSYRENKKSIVDSAGALRRTNKSINFEIKESCNLTDLVILSLGQPDIDINNKDVALKQISILNGYLFNYYSSPIVKILGYFDEEYSKMWSQYADALLKKIINNNRCYIIQAEESKDFSKILHEII